MAGDSSNKRITKATGNAPLPSPESPFGSAAPVRRAAAISYDPDVHDAPVLAAFGEGYVADKIVSVAKESGVPVIPDPNLSSMLSKISVGDEIPEELYEAVAKVLVFVSEIDRKYGEKLGIRK